MTETVDLAPGDYKFTIKDRRGTDEFRGFKFFELSYFDRQQRSGLGGYKLLYKSEGLFSGEESTTTFTIPVSAAVGTSGSELDSSVSSPEVIIGDASFMEEAQIELGMLAEAETEPEEICTADGHTCTAFDECCSGLVCSRFRCTSVSSSSSVSHRDKGTISGGAGGAFRGDGYGGV